MFLQIADVKHLLGREGQPKAEPAQNRHLADPAPAVDPINLPQFAARPQVPVGIEHQPFRMIEPIRKDFKFFCGNQRFGRTFHGRWLGDFQLGVESEFAYQPNISAAFTLVNRADICPGAFCG